MKRNISKASTVVFLVLAVSLTGCEQVNKLVDYFSAKPKKASTKMLPPAISSPTGVSSPETVRKAETPATGAAEMKPNTLVKVGNWTMTIEEFAERLKALKEAVPEYDVKDLKQNKMILQELVRQQLLVDEAEKTGVAKNKDIAMAVEEFRRTLLVREMANQLVKDTKVTDAEAQKYYEDNKKDFAEPAEWHVREIVCETEDEAKKTLVELYNGADFADMVKQKSKGKSAWKKGDLGFIKTFDFPQMENTVSALEVGGLSGVFKGPEGFYIVKLEEKKGGAAKSFDELKTEIINGLTLLKQQQIILEHLDKLQKQTDVKQNDKLLEDLKI